MPKVILINGSPREKGCTYTGLSEIARVLESRGIATEIVQVGPGAVPGCNGCGACANTGRCRHEDGVNYILAQLDQVDGIVVGSPVYYAAASGQVTAFMDRLFWGAGRRMEGKVGAAIASCRRAGSTATLDQLHKYFAIAAMPIATSRYWPMIHGSTPEEVRQDREGMDVMALLGENIAWLIGCIRAGREAGVTPPPKTKIARTDFIR